MPKLDTNKPVNLQLNVDEDESLSVDEALARIAMLLGRTQYPKVMTELDESEIKLCAALFSVAERTRNTMILSFLENFLLLRVSHKRKGRQELLEIAKSSKESTENRWSKLKNIFTGAR